MCACCGQFVDTVIAAPDDAFVVLHEKLVNGVDTGILAIEDGSLQYEDIITCTLSCEHCGRTFSLSCNVYHGRGGYFRTVT